MIPSSLPQLSQSSHGSHLSYIVPKSLLSQLISNSNRFRTFESDPIDVFKRYLASHMDDTGDEEEKRLMTRLKRDLSQAESLLSQHKRNSKMDLSMETIAESPLEAAPGGAKSSMSQPDQDILVALPPDVREKAQNLLSLFKYSSSIGRNGSGNLVISGRSVPGSNLADLILAVFARDPPGLKGAELERYWKKKGIIGLDNFML